MSNIVHIVAAVVDTAQVTFYKKDGSTLIIPQGDSRLARIIRQITPVCAQGDVAEVDLDAFPDDSAKVFIDYEERSGGIIKFLRIAKNKLTSLFSAPIPEVSMPEQAIGTPVVQQYLNAAAEIAAHAKPMTEGINRTALESTQDDAETIVAVMNDAVIPDVHMLEAQFKRSNEQTNTIGMQRFMERVASVANKRSHSVQDLMRFMQRGDLPVAEDGCIVIYKILRKKVLPAHPKFTYVDCHSGNVPQRVGSYVHMDESMVDMNRRNECSNGLHVARRGYLKDFTGDVATICKVPPEDVIAVPEGDHNKMRVCGYHIISELSPDDYAELRVNRPIASKQGLKLLADALSGQHPAANTSVKITGEKGGGIIITDLVVTAPRTTVIQPAVEATVLDTETSVYVAEKVDVRTVATAVSAVKGRAEIAADLLILWKKAKGQKHKTDCAKALRNFKRSKKVGWDKLGITPAQAQNIEADAAK